MSFFQVLSDLCVRDLENQIINYCDNKTLSAISCTQKYAYEKLTNDGIFKDRFLELYQSVHPAPEKLFPHFQKNYPDCCWKICSCLYPEAQPIIVFERKFLQEAQSVIDKENEKCSLEARLQTICGTGYGDPNSPIHKAWEAYQTFKKSNKESIKRQSNLFGVYYELNDRMRTLTFLLKDYPKENTWLWEESISRGRSPESMRAEKCKLEEELRTICGSGYGDPNSPIHKAWEAYHPVKESNEELQNHLNTLYRKYEHFNSEKRTIANQLDDHTDEMSALKKDLIIGLLVDQYYAKNLNLFNNTYFATIFVPGLIKKLVQILERPEPSCNSSDLVHYMRFTLQTPPELTGMILEVLYHTCANGVSEDNWGTNHCGEYIPEMLSICKRLLVNFNQTS